MEDIARAFVSETIHGPAESTFIIDRVGDESARHQRAPPHDPQVRLSSCSQRFDRAQVILPEVSYDSEPLRKLSRISVGSQRVDTTDCNCLRVCESLVEQGHANGRVERIHNGGKFNEGAREDERAPARYAAGSALVFRDVVDAPKNAASHASVVDQAARLRVMVDVGAKTLSQKPSDRIPVARQLTLVEEPTNAPRIEGEGRRASCSRVDH